ncbi:DUF3800 domain-containing protein [Virgibacillus halophilus]|uniref:DUF3800 domain-containing protein n=1 Tax=Tigheibacillus halophilus TaxID=361280 RepID=A0ABU5C7Z0_9BACI|nr:DUF3800 domain-containing protein [Virgibacillus halophilus]
MTKVILNFDESGNMGRKGRYFTIACVETHNTKPLINVMKKACLKVKKEFPHLTGNREIKASDSFPVIKDYILRRIVTKDIKIRYATADLPYVNRKLLEDENLLYNFLLHFIIVPVAKRSCVNEIDIFLDKRSIKVESLHSFKNYISIKINYELKLDVKINVSYVESHNSYCIQVADFLANVINSYYEYGHDHCFKIIKPKIVQHEKFPRHMFGKDIE